MSDEEDLEDFEPDQIDEEREREDDEKETDMKEEEDISEEWTPIPLTEDVMKEGLSLLCKTGDGLAHAYAKLDVKKRGLTDIYLLHSYIHLRYVDISENHLTDLSPLNYLTHLLWLKADGNRLQSAQLNELPCLQAASFAYNQITDTEGISHPYLGILDLKGNYIRIVTGLDPPKLIDLHTLELRGNQLESTLGINLPKLKNLFLVAHWVRGWLVQGRGHHRGGQDAWLLGGSTTNFIIIMVIADRITPCSSLGLKLVSFLLKPDEPAPKLATSDLESGSSTSQSDALSTAPPPGQATSILILILPFLPFFCI
ncbi:leucine-rich repeat-containing protein 23 isoform X3 [Saccopteryx leptura]|uniref:leucine-rich repeat-containing protein 23 isoform X3 n=1 Tax=Saccopteryx leptura TaxID=249018 RepID=UPI00339D1ABE